MKIPNSERAAIAIDKLTGYLLNISHKRGGANRDGTRHYASYED